jgi:uncharacterized protein
MLDAIDEDAIMSYGIHHQRSGGMKTVCVKNATRGTIVAEQAEVADNVLTRLRGLLGRKSLAAGGGMVIRPTNQIHTFFMQFPIDVLFLDKQGAVLLIIPDMKRGRISPLVRHGKMVIELPVGAIASSQTQKGDHIDMAA